VLVALVVGGFLVAPAQADPAPRFTSPTAYGAVELGRSVPVVLAGRGCEHTVVQAVARFRGGSVRGSHSVGCRGAVTLPSASALRARGWQEGESVQLELVAGSTTLPLRHKHLEPDLGRVVAGVASAVPAASDPQGDANALAMAAGSIVDLGSTSLEGIYAVAVRAAGAGAYELRTGSPNGPAVVSDYLGSLHGLPVLDVAIRRPGWERTPWSLITSQVTSSPSRPAHLFLALTSGSALINFVDLTGSGVMQPYQRPARVPGAKDLFNGRDFSGWKHVGDSRFRIVDGAMQAVDCPPQPSGGASVKLVGCIGFEYYALRRYTNFHLRVDFSLTKFGDNAGVLIRHDETGDYTHAEEIQLTDVNTEYVGGIDHAQVAFRQPQDSPGRWSTLDIIANGPHIKVMVNGIVTSLYDGSAGCSILYLPCSGGANHGYGEGGVGYVSMENEVGQVRFRDIELYECHGGDDPRCAMDVAPLGIS
jgi:hypothetical protein